MLFGPTLSFSPMLTKGYTLRRRSFYGFQYAGRELLNLRDCEFQTTRQLCVVWSLLTISALTPKVAYVLSGMLCAVTGAQRASSKAHRPRPGRANGLDDAMPMCPACMLCLLIRRRVNVPLLREESREDVM